MHPWRQVRPAVLPHPQERQRQHSLTAVGNPAVVFQVQGTTESQPSQQANTCPRVTFNQVLAIIAGNDPPPRSIRPNRSQQEITGCHPNVSVTKIKFLLPFTTSPSPEKAFTPYLRKAKEADVDRAGAHQSRSASRSKTSRLNRYHERGLASIFVRLGISAPTT